VELNVVSDQCYDFSFSLIFVFIEFFFSRYPNAVSWTVGDPVIFGDQSVYYRMLWNFNRWRHYENISW